MVSAGRAAHFDFGVVQGVAAARADRLARANKSARKTVERVMHEDAETDVPPAVRVDAPELAAWTTMGLGEHHGVRVARSSALDWPRFGVAE